MAQLNHERYMRRAIALAANVPARPFGSVIVDRTSGEFLAEGWNRTSLNPIWHGEIDAINRLAESDCKLQDRELLLYTTAEPCAMCQGAILWTGIDTVFFGASIRYLQSLGWNQIEIPAEEIARRTPFRQCRVIGGILEQQCNVLFEEASRKS